MTVAALVWLGWPVESCAQLSDWGGPSLDCDRASEPIELLICSDPELIRLDRELGVRFADQLRDGKDRAQAQRFLADQRAWLPTRMSLCSPTGQFHREDAACVADVYRERLTALGAPADVVGRNLELPLPDGMLHPLCMEKIAGYGDDELEARPAILVEACNRAYRHIPFDPRLPSVKRTLEGSFSYSFVGILDDGREVVWVQDMPGTQVILGAIVAIAKRTAEKLGDTEASAEVLVGFHERHNFGIAYAGFVEDKLFIDSYVTPLKLFWILGMADVPDSVPDCVVCRIGTIRKEVDIKSKELRFVSVTLTDVGVLSDFAGDNGSGSGPSQRISCLIRALKDRIDSVAREHATIAEDGVTILSSDVNRIARSCK